MKSTSNQYNQLPDSIGLTIEQARQNAFIVVNTELVKTNWEIGRHIVEYEQRGQERAEYGSKLLTKLSKDLRQRYGKGFGRRNILDMRNEKHTLNENLSVRELERQIDSSLFERLALSKDKKGVLEIE
ncbi:DUF1016 N-terminal domain-containing protein [Agriterribacter sp.]|uniref:DUF1016 N-terminal domain-containing protein n=1 Tax=Agriterribacter sp. TaxID=2821509 RepID=UPI002B963B02|nr:DUF1016 N-terminal domain-containing protein [Agriterribacter sp.]HRO46702.1 DUF1016 N-terminal domain-containing protein [Agriterribacter sp.]HRQ16958.1 DUF1016 N-terminal domain-containing protein [Agriterribacter sp.]